MLEGRGLCIFTSRGTGQIYSAYVYIYIYINKHISPPISPHLFPQPYLSSWYLPIYILSLIPHIGFIALSL